MQTENRLFDDLARLMNGAVGTLAGAGREAEGALRERMRDWVGGLDMVSREEFDAVRELAVNARAEVEALRAELRALQGAAPAPALAATVVDGGSVGDGEGGDDAADAHRDLDPPAPDRGTPVQPGVGGPHTDIADADRGGPKDTAFPPKGPDAPRIDEQPGEGTARPSDFA